MFGYGNCSTTRLDRCKICGKRKSPHSPICDERGCRRQYNRELRLRMMQANKKK